MSHPTSLLEGIPFWARSSDGGVLFEEIPTRAGGTLPSFFIIGAAKAATTSLQAYLRQHPQLFMCDPKEPHFFSTDAIYERGIDWYKGLFADAAPGQRCGEASTSYTRYPNTPDVPKRIHELVPDAKLIYILREPIARVESACVYALRREVALNQKVFTHSIDAIISEAEIIPQTSEYITQIEHYLRLFDRDQLLILLQEDLEQDPGAALARVFEFLEVDPKFEADASKRLNQTSAFVDGLKDEHASTLAYKIPGYASLKKLLPDAMVQGVKRLITTRLEQDDVIEPMSEDMRAQLRRRFAPFNRQLGEFLGRDLSHWDARSH